MRAEQIGIPERIGVARAPQALWHKRLALEERLGLREGDESDFHHFAPKWRARAAEWILKAGGLYRRGRRNARAPRLRTEVFRFPQLPAHLEGTRILHLSDFHFSANDGVFTQACRTLLDGVQVDFCVLTGDYRYGHFGPQTWVPDHLGPVLAGVTAPHGFFAVLGNHDISDVVGGLESLGVAVLINTGLLAGGRERPLWLGGVDDPHKFRAASVADAFAGAPGNGVFRLLLAHSPEVIADAAQAGADLYLCGHTHGGQVRLPCIGAFEMNARCPARYTRGRWTYGAMQGYTTDGLGTTDLPVRYNCPPEAVIIELHRGADN